MTVVQYGNHIIVSLIPGFNGGFNQLFFIQYRNIDRKWWTTTSPIKDNMENKIKYTIYELVSNKQYSVRMFSRNVVRDSETTNVKEATVFDKYIIWKILVGYRIDYFDSV